jgi:hypothetical protein
MKLFLVELRRLTSRRLFRFTVLAALLTVLVVDGLIAARSSTDIAGARATAVNVEQQQYADCLALASAHPAATDAPTKGDCDRQRPAAQAQACLAQVGHGPVTVNECNRVREMFVNDPRFHFADHARDLLTGGATILMAVAIVLGASATGAEWQSGTFAALLTWEPRRQRVLSAKLVAPVVGMTAITAVVLPLLVAGGWVAARTRGTTAGTNGHVWAQLAAQYGRSVGLLALVTLIAAGLGAVARHTVAALAVVGGYLVAGEIVGGVVSRWWHTHALAAHLYALMQGTWTYTKVTVTATGEQPQLHTLHAAGAAVLVAVIAALAAVAASATLARRDVA